MSINRTKKQNILIFKSFDTLTGSVAKGLEETTPRRHKAKNKFDNGGGSRSAVGSLSGPMEDPREGLQCNKTCPIGLGYKKDDS